MKSQKALIKKTLKKNLNTTKLYHELISLGAFNGDHYKFTHFSQACFLRGLRNKYTYYNNIDSIGLLSRATRFLKANIKTKKYQIPAEFIFVGNQKGSEEESRLVFKSIEKTFFPNDKWLPGFFSKKPAASNYVLIIYNLTQNNIAFQEAVNSNIPVVAFVSPKCDLRGVDYPIILNLSSNNMWYTNFCYSLFIK